MDETHKATYINEWTCCSCREHDAMEVDALLECPGCYHQRCNSCVIKAVQVKTPDPKSFPESREAEFSGSIARHGPRHTSSAPRHVTFAELTDYSHEFSTLRDRTSLRLSSSRSLTAAKPKDVSYESNAAENIFGFPLSSSQSVTSAKPKDDSNESNTAKDSSNLPLQSSQPISPAKFKSDPYKGKSGATSLPLRSFSSMPVGPTKPVDISNEPVLPTSSSLSPTGALIPLISSNSNNTPLFPLDVVNDETLLAKWHDIVLPAISSQKDKFRGLRSVHLLRRGSTKLGSIPTIYVTYDDGSRVEPLHESISTLFEKEARSSTQISFEQAALRRTVTQGDPPICGPRNTSGQRYLSSGASIGIQGRTDSTATLGGFLMVDGSVVIMTVDHLIPSIMAAEEAVVINHPSEQENMLFHIHRFLLRVDALQLCCLSCKILANEDSKPIEVSQLLDPPYCECENARLYWNAKKEMYLAQPKSVGALEGRSKMRSRTPVDRGDYMVEMDWALFNVEQWPLAMKAYAQTSSQGLSLSKVVPGARIFATGRTSGRQRGVINTAMCLISHGDRFTREWSVIRRRGSNLDDWIKGGIGVDGDSGAWIIDQDSCRVYGMAWGRDRPYTDPICLFSPIEDIIADIKDRTGAKSVCLTGEEGIDVKRARGKEEMALLTALISAQSLVEGSATRSIEIEVNPAGQPSAF